MVATSAWHDYTVLRKETWDFVTIVLKEEFGWLKNTRCTGHEKKNVCSTQKIKINRGIRREWLSIQWHKGEKLFLPPKSDKKRPQRTLQACRGSTVSGCPFLSVYVIASVINTLVMSLHKIITCEYYWFCNLCYIRGCLGCTYWGRLLPAPYT